MSRRRWVAAGAATAAAGGGAVWVGLETADKIGSVVGAVCGVLGLGLSAYGLLRAGHAEPPPAAGAAPVTNSITDSANTELVLQVYDRLAVAYRRAGHVELARRVGMAKQRQRRRQLGLVGKAWSLLLGATVGHGYRPWLAGVWLMGLLALGGVVFGAAYLGELTPAAPAVPEFNAFAHAIDVLVPVVDLGQRKAWVAHGPAQLWAWALTGAGWILTTAVIAGLTNALKRE